MPASPLRRPPSRPLRIVPSPPPRIEPPPPTAVPSTPAVRSLAMLAWQSRFDPRLSTETLPRLTRPDWPPVSFSDELSESQPWADPLSPLPPTALPSTAAVRSLAMLAWQSRFDPRLPAETLPTPTRPDWSPVEFSDELSESQPWADPLSPPPPTALP